LAVRKPKDFGGIQNLFEVYGHLGEFFAADSSEIGNTFKEYALQCYEELVLILTCMGTTERLL